MNILLVLLIYLVFVLEFIIVHYYECKIINMSKNHKNNVRFYVARDADNSLWLFLCKPKRSKETFMPTSPGRIITSEIDFSNYGLDVKDYANLKWEDEPVEVFLNLEN